MDNIGYIEAWLRWFSGESTSELYLWGLQILWWGRFGKIISFIAGLVVVAEIIGSNNLLLISNDLRTTIDLNNSSVALKNQWDTSFNDIRSRNIISPFYGRLFNYVFRTGKFQIFKMLGFLSVSAVLIYLVFIGNWLGNSVLLVILFDFFRTFVWKFVVPGLAFLYKIIIIIPVYVAGYFITNIALLIAMFADDKNAKIFSVVLLMLGFHFDLLAS